MISTSTAAFVCASPLPISNQSNSLCGKVQLLQRRQAYDVSKSRRSRRAPTHTEFKNDRRNDTVTSVWVERSATVKIEVQPEEVFVYYSDIQNLPLLSPWVKKVEIDNDDPLISRWKLGARGLEFDWSARMTVVDRGERIAWTSQTGLKNEGNVTFVQDTDQNTLVTLAIRFNVPGFVASLFDVGFVKNFVDDTLAADLKRLRTVTLQRKRKRVSKGLAVPEEAAPAVEQAIQILQAQR